MTWRPFRHEILLGALLLAGIGLAVLRFVLDRPPEPVGGSLRLAWPEPEWAMLRLYAICAAIIVGAALGLAGLLLQTLLRNPLASPYILGLSSGAGLGVAIATFGAMSGWLPHTTMPMDTAAAMAGAMTVLALVYVLGRRHGWIDPLTLVLVGVVVSALCAAGIMLIEFMAPAGVIHDIVRWMFGRIPMTGSTWALGGAAIVVGGSAVLAVCSSASLDASLFSDDEATSIGVNLGAIRLMMLLLAGLLTAIAVAIAGPIGFVGIIAPHVARLLVGVRHRTLIVATILCGAVLLLAADCVSQALYLESGRLPVGIFTAFVGGPVFIWLLRRRGSTLSGGGAW